MRNLLIFVALGLGPGAVHALLGLGLVAIYRGSGVLNFAHGAIGMYTAYVFVVLRQDRGVPTPLAVLAALGVAALLGLVIYGVIMRPLRHAPVLARVTGTLGALLTLQAVAYWQFGSTVRSVDSLVPAGGIDFVGVNLAYNRLVLFAVAVVIALALWALYRFTLFGLATRAAAESEKGAAVTGYSQVRLAALNWVIGAVLAGIGGVLVAPLTRLDSTSLSLLIVPALAAGLLGRFEHLWIVLAGGIGIGIGESLMTYLAPTIPGLTAAVPFLVIVVVLVAQGRALPARGEIVSADLPLAPAATRVGTKLALLSVVLLGLFLTLSARYAAALTVALIGAIVILSLVVIVGYVGQISLCQIAFSGVGAYLAIRAANHLLLPFPMPVLVGALAALVAGVLVGLPALRVRGTSLAIVTLGAGLALERLYFNNSALTGQEVGQTTPVPALFGLSIDGRVFPERYGLFVAVIFVACLWGVYNLRSSPTGRQMLAVRADEGAAAAAGVNVTRVKLQAFALAAFLAGLAGALAAYRTTRVAPQNFAVFQSIFYLAIAYIGGIATAGGAAIGALFIPGNPVAQLLRQSVNFPRLIEVLSGLALIINVVTQPDGLANLVRNERSKRAARRHRRELRAGQEQDDVRERVGAER